MRTMENPCRASAGIFTVYWRKTEMNKWPFPGFTHSVVQDREHREAIFSFSSGDSPNPLRANSAEERDARVASQLERQEMTHTASEASRLMVFLQRDSGLREFEVPPDSQGGVSSACSTAVEQAIAVAPRSRLMIWPTESSFSIK